MIAYLWVAIGGALGSVARFWLSNFVGQRIGESFPWGTLTINVTGSFVIGLISAFTAAEGRMDTQTRLFVVRFLMVGICGGYTTFSSFSLQTLNLIQDRQWLAAGGYIIFSVVLCLIAVWLGYLIGVWARH